jgi:hypothetical protein
MALIRHLEPHTLEMISEHRETEATYSLVSVEGKTYLQIDTYGSKERKLKGKKSQSMRFAPEAVAELKQIVGTISDVG